MPKLNFKDFFENAYVLYFHCIENYAFTFLRDREEAKSLAQEVFIRFWEKIDCVDMSRSPLPYLMTMARNSCLNCLRHKKHTDTYVDYRLNRFYQDVLEYSNSNKIFYNEVQEIITRSLDEMSLKVRETFMLSRNKCLKNKEIAEIEKISLSTVEYRLAMAFKILKKNLKDYMVLFLWFLTCWV